MIHEHIAKFPTSTPSILTAAFVSKNAPVSIFLSSSGFVTPLLKYTFYNYGFLLGLKPAVQKLISLCFVAGF